MTGNASAKTSLQRGLLSAVGVVTGLGPRRWMFVTDQSAATELLARIHDWPSVAADQAAGIAVRHRTDATGGQHLCSSNWGYLAAPTFERFSVKLGAGGLVVDQRVAPLFAFVGSIVMLATIGTAALGVTKAATGEPRGLIVLGLVLFVRVAWFETTRIKAKSDFSAFLRSGATASGGRQQVA